MSTYKPIDSRQVINRAALSNIGSAAGASLDVILADINAVLAAVAGGSGYYAAKISLTSGSTSQVVTVPAQPDASYIVLGMMGNLVDSHPQYQQIETTAKSSSGFTFKWNHPLDTSNYFISFIIPYKVFPEVESAIGSGANTLASTLPIAQPFSGYGVISQLQNLVDANPQFQTVVVGSNTNSTVNLSFNAPTDSVNYQAAYMVGATGQVAIPSSATSITVSLPVSYGSTPNYAVIATMQDTVDAHPQFQPIAVIAETASSVTFGWNVATDSANYLLNYYSISLTP
jgi:hypothetical protein